VKLSIFSGAWNPKVGDQLCTAWTQTLSFAAIAPWMKNEENERFSRSHFARFRSFVRSRKDLLVDAGGCSWQSRSRTRFRVRLRSKTSRRSFTAIRTFRAKPKCSRTKSPPSPDVSPFPDCAICSRRCCRENDFVEDLPQRPGTILLQFTSRAAENPY